MMIYIVASRDWHSLEVAFTDKEDAKKYVTDHGGPGKFDVIPMRVYGKDEGETE